MINQRQLTGWTYLTILIVHCTMMTFAYPQTEMIMPRRMDFSTQIQPEPSNQLAPVYRADQQQQQPQYQQQQQDSRKFAVKPNHSKKVELDDVENDIEANQLPEGNGASFTWSNMLSTFLQMFFNGGAAGGGALVGPNKSDDVDNVGGFGQSPWANVISVGLKIINTLLGGGAPSDGIDKVDNGSPMQGILAAVLSSVLGTKDPEQVNSMAKQAGEFINIVMNLLDALKTSFSHRSLAARSIGKRDSMSDATVAGISMLKGYVRTYRNAEDKCMQKYICDANTECVKEIGGTSIFCQLGTYATSLILERTSGSQFENLYDAGKRGRSGLDCSQLFLECNEV
ncbi:uncharacterized protein LOC129939986 isoform X1 [Eupeodes corollae]|uniref:uncharacterized protein LOC129939986 isoform X1 n=1 Tax=Eupeodes corollae TaxID=290404 RepID=UPI002491CC53|nr:uncharacterized protein LOC129939986 isoform X1 [Eupeodes corollae]XP_055904173.1 uncharacterized protein LOC129939986 isoform X1 [Eupeodes corollae]